MTFRSRPTIARPYAWIVAALLLAACGGDEGPTDRSADAAPTDDASGDGAAACGAADAIPVETAELVAAADGSLVDPAGRLVVLRGLNTGGRSKWAPYLPFEVGDPADLDEVAQAATAYFGRFAEWGLDTARMPFSWEGLEPEAGNWDDAYLDRYATLVDTAWDAGIRVIVDFHQDVFASQFCGDGFPPWTVADILDGPPRRDCADWFTGYLTNPDVAAAFDRLWEPEGELRAAFEAMWTRVATRFAGHPGVVAFEIINEPHWGTGLADPWKRDVLQPFHTELAALLHGIAPGKLVLYDSTGIDAVAPQETHYRPDGDFLVYAPHFYDFGLLAGREPTSPAPSTLVARFEAVREQHGVHVLIGEFGYTDGTEGGAGWLTETMGAIDRHRLSATLWEYSVSPDLWNEEDLSVVDADGSDRGILDAYVRPWLRAVSGTDPTFEWDPVTRRGTATWTADGGVTEIRVPPRLVTGPVEVSVEPATACAVHDAERGELRVAAPDGAQVVVSFGM